MNRAHRSLGMLLVAAGTSLQASAQYYTVDQTTSELGIYDADTGSFQLIGPVTVPIGALSDLEFVGDRLFGLESGFPNGAWLIEYDPATGATIDRNPVTRNGVVLVNAIEAIGYDGTDLYVSFWDNGVSVFHSNKLAQIGFDGAVDPATTLSPVIDGDSIGHRVGGGLWFADICPPEQTVAVYRADAPPTTAAQVVEFDHTPTVNAYVGFADRGDVLLANNASVGLVHKISRDSGQVVSSMPMPLGRSLTVGAYAMERCAADVNGDGVVSPADFTAWLGCFNNPISQPYCGNADVNNDGSLTPADFTAWLAAFNAGCP